MLVVTASLGFDLNFPQQLIILTSLRAYWPLIYNFWRNVCSNIWSLQTCSLPCWQWEGPRSAASSCWQSPVRAQLTHCPDTSMNHKLVTQPFPFVNITRVSAYSHGIHFQKKVTRWVDEHILFSTEKVTLNWKIETQKLLYRWYLREEARPTCPLWVKGNYSLPQVRSNGFSSG